MLIKTLRVTNLGPFDKVDFEFDPHVNVLVGPDNCGKSTALFAIADILDRTFDLPRKLIRDGDATFMISISDGANSGGARTSDPGVQGARGVAMIECCRWHESSRRG